jgi:hypothetical protein
MSYIPTFMGIGFALGLYTSLEEIRRIRKTTDMRGVGNLFGQAAFFSALGVIAGSIYDFCILANGIVPPYIR